MSVAPTRTLSTDPGTEVPVIGFGTYPLRGSEGVAAIASALEVGYRFVDTAVNYRNEREVAEAVKASGIAREDVWLQTKVPGRDHTGARRCVETSLQVMDLDYLDSVVIHWPNPSRDEYLTAWEQLVEAREAGLVRHIGVSNFTAAHLDRVVEATGVTPFANQIELHPYFPQEQMRAVDSERGILTQSWSPIARGGDLFEEQAVVAAAEAHDLTPGQVVLAWHVALGAMPLPKSADAQRQRDNLAAASVQLGEDEVAAITALGRADGRLFDADPDHHEEL
ncbi:aldo/keto reductase [Janibacter melonis]|uniref:aldo/keto reductase n=1 Tax=Janibacter melonis TaxID=262209 RepID=UPI00174CBFEF|nr:aldo/keto reductase [Janibacter melonis]